VTLSANFALSLESLGPEEALDLTQELEAALEGTGSHAMLRMTSAAAAAVVLREPIVFRALCAFADARGQSEVRLNAVKIAAAFAHPSPADARDAKTRLITSALERGLRMVPSARTERVDPLLHACADIVELVNAISTWRFAMPETIEVVTPAPPSVDTGAEAAPISAGGGRRRLTRDFEVEPPGSVSPRHTDMPGSGDRPIPARSTMRPSPARSTLRPTPIAQGDVEKDAVLIPRTQVRDAQGRPLKKKW
jgi:hypothetical protein